MTLTRIALGAFLSICAVGSVHADDKTMSAAGKTAPVDQALMKSMDAMNTGMAAPMTGDPDRDFVTMMLPHHAGAVAMAKVQLKYGKDPVLRAMARDIVASQDKEIATMKAWQAQHGK